MAHAILNHQSIKNVFWDIDLLNPPLDPANKQFQLGEVKSLLLQIARLEEAIKLSNISDGKSQLPLNNQLDSSMAKLKTLNAVWRTPEDEADDFTVSILSRIDPTFYVDYASFTYVEMAILAGERAENLTSKAVASCAQAQSKGTDVPIGSPSNPGHGSCYRFRNIFFSLYINPQLKAPVL